MDDKINPSHYKQGKYETIDVIESVTGEGFESYLVGNIIKYVSRYKYKNGVECLKKARWYLDRLIRSVEIERLEPVEEPRELAHCGNCEHREGSYCRTHEKLVECMAGPCEHWTSRYE